MGYFWDNLWILCEYVLDTFWILLWYFWNTLVILLWYFWNTFGIVFIYFWYTCWISSSFFSPHLFPLLPVSFRFFLFFLGSTLLFFVFLDLWCLGTWYIYALHDFFVLFQFGDHIRFLAVPAHITDVTCWSYSYSQQGSCKRLSHCKVARKPWATSTRESENRWRGLWLPCLLRRLTWVAAETMRLSTHSEYYLQGQENFSKKSSSTIFFSCLPSGPILETGTQLKARFSIVIKQTFNVWAEVRSVSNFFWNHQFELIFHKFFPKRNWLSILVTKPLRNFFWRTFFNYCRFLELIHLQNRVFHTYISSNAAETLQFEDLAV